MFLSWPVCSNAFADDFDDCRVHRSGTRYCNLSKHRSKIMGPIKNKHGKEYSFEDAALNLFSLQSMGMYNGEDENVLFRINKTEFGPRDPARRQHH